jgi:NADPH:quinone reductase-like Zn-dependent oxidoreductase
VAIEARNVAPLPAGVDHAVAAGAVISGLTAWQALFDHAHVRAGQTALIHGAAGGVGSIAVQLVREVGSRVIGTGRGADRDRVLGLGVDEFVDLETDRLEDAGEADVVLDVIGGDILERSIALVRAGGTLVTTIQPPTIQPENGRAIFFVVEADRSQLAELAAAARRATDLERGSRAAAGRSARRVRPKRSARVREDDHPSHRRLVDDHDRCRCRHR